MRKATHIHSNLVTGITPSSKLKSRLRRRYPNRWMKAPKRGYCPTTGLTRTALYRLGRRGKIKTASIREPGASRGNRLYHLGSILAYLDQVAVEPIPPDSRPEQV